MISHFILIKPTGLHPLTRSRVILIKHLIASTSHRHLTIERTWVIINLDRYH